MLEGSIAILIFSVIAMVFAVVVKKDRLQDHRYGSRTAPSHTLSKL